MSIDNAGFSNVENMLRINAFEGSVETEAYVAMVRR